MNEYMLRILNKHDAQKKWSSEKHEEFVKKCEVYIRELQSQGKLIAAQPLEREGVLISRISGSWKKEKLSAGKDMQVGYYHIRAKDMNDAIAIAKKNPEFAYGTTARIEVRPIKTSEEETGFEYPTTE